MLIAWILLSILVGIFGEKRNIGFMWAMTLSLLMSPLVGFLVVLVSEKKADPEMEKLKAEIELLKNK